MERRKQSSCGLLQKTALVWAATPLSMKKIVLAICLLLMTIWVLVFPEMTNIAMFGPCGLLSDSTVACIRVDCFVDPDTGDQRDVPEAWNDRKAKEVRQSSTGSTLFQRLSARFVGLLRAITSFFTTIGALITGSLLFLTFLIFGAVGLSAWCVTSLAHRSSSTR